MSFWVFKQRLGFILLVLLMGYGLIFGTLGLLGGLIPDLTGVTALIPKDKFYAPPPKNYVSKWERDITALKQRIPPGVERVGYIADWNLNPETAAPDQYMFYYLTQYSLAPIWVEGGYEHEWIILYSAETNPEAWLDAQLGTYQIESLGYRFYLIHQTETK